MEYHIHIYKIIGKAEVDLEKESVQAAQIEALQQAKTDSLQFSKSHCSFIAIASSIREARCLGDPARI